MSIRAIVVDDEPLARDELRFMLGQCEGVEVVGEARNAPEAQKLCHDERPDVAFLDLRMPGPDGVALAETLIADHPALKVVIVSAHDEGALREFERLAQSFESDGFEQIICDACFERSQSPFIVR